MASQTELFELLESRVVLYNRPDFIPDDPISIPHRFSTPEDQEIAGFLAATLAWGRRASILQSADRLLQVMDNSPYAFLMHHTESDLKRFEGFVHRTFQTDDALFFISRLAELYRGKSSLQALFGNGYTEAGSAMGAITAAHQVFFASDHLPRTRKHFSNPAKGSAAKRLHMYLRWMCRKDDAGVDLGIWDAIPPSELQLPLDVHTSNVGRQLGLLTRAANDRKAVEEITNALCAFDPHDPIKYDFALFGMGVEGVQL